MDSLIGLTCLLYARIRRNLANCFELPVLFVACVGLLVALGAVTTFDVAMAWAFLVGRVAHILVRTQTDDVSLRGRIFTLKFMAFAGMDEYLNHNAFSNELFICPITKYINTLNL